MEWRLAAAAEARRLGHDSVRPTHVLLALLRAGESRAADALRAVGYVEDDLPVPQVAAGGERLTIARTMDVVRGRAEAFAATLPMAAADDRTITPEHVLLALMWDSNPVVGRRGDIDVRPEILRQLVACGVPVPPCPPPDLLPRWTQHVELFDATDWAAVCDHLIRIGARDWGTNPLNPSPGTLSTFVAGGDIDLLAEIERAVGPGRARPLPLAD